MSEVRALGAENDSIRVGSRGSERGVGGIGGGGHAVGMVRDLT